MNQFFSRQVGPSPTPVDVYTSDHPALIGFATLEVGNVAPIHLPPDQAKALGRALIKAGKFAEKKTAAKTV